MWEATSRPGAARCPWSEAVPLLKASRTRSASQCRWPPLSCAGPASHEKGHQHEDWPKPRRVKPARVVRREHGLRGGHRAHADLGAEVPDEDLATVKRTVSQWNWNTGRPSHLTVVPVSWSEHAVAEFGDRPQEVLNGQLVEDADMALALFADRLGTPTGAAESGTLEEIDRMVEAGKHVSVLVNQAPRSLSGEAAVAEKSRLEAALTGLRQRAIILPYTDQAMLAGPPEQHAQHGRWEGCRGRERDACTERASGRRQRLASRCPRALPRDRQQGTAED